MIHKSFRVDRITPLMIDLAEQFPFINIYGPQYERPVY